MKPGISVVLPVYNGGRFLRQAIESVLSQTHRDFELIAWNDASTDNSKQIIESYGDERLRIFSSKINLGLFKTLNLGIDKAEGEWIRLWSQDDVMREDCLATEAKFCERFPLAGLGLCSYEAINENGAVTVVPEPVHPTPVISRETVNQLLFYRGCLPGTISTVVIRSSVLKDVGRFSEDMRIAGDFELWVRIARKYSFFFVKDRLVSVRFHPSQLSGRPDSYVTCMREVKAVYEELLSRLPEEIQSYAKWFDCMTRGARYMHHLVRCVLARDLANARAAYKEIRRLDHNLLAAVYWLLSANQNLFEMRPRYQLKSGRHTSDFTKFVLSSSQAN